MGWFCTRGEGKKRPNKVSLSKDRGRWDPFVGRGDSRSMQRKKATEGIKLFAGPKVLKKRLGRRRVHGEPPSTL